MTAEREPTTGEEAPESVVWGVNTVLEILGDDPGRIAEIAILRSKTGPKIHEIVSLARTHRIKLRMVEKLPVSSGARSGAHQGVAARIIPFSYTSWEELLRRIQGLTDPVLLAADCVQDPHNLGALLRSAAAAGVVGVITTKDRSAPLSGTVAKVSAGAITRLPVCRVTNLTTALQDLKRLGFWIFGAAAHVELSLYKADFRGPVCLVMGGEGSGIRPLVRKQCDLLISIPMQREMESLNVSVAAAVILFEIARQRKA